MKRWIILLHIVIPLLSGALIYILTDPNVLFVRMLSRQRGIPVLPVNSESTVVLFVRCYLLDILWAYALIFSLYFILDTDMGLWKIFGIGFLFSTIMEVLQLTVIVPGTFDLWDILMEGVAELIAIFIIKNQEEGKVS